MNFGFEGEKTRIVSQVARRIRFEERDHWNHCIRSSEGRDMTRVISRVLVERILSWEGRMVAIDEPLGLGMDWLDAVVCQYYSLHMAK